MQIVLSLAPGDPASLQLTERPDPVAGAGEVVVRVRAASLNFYDTLIIADRYQLKAPRPFAPGGEIAGEVLSVGAGVDAVRPGDRVAAYVKWGGCAEQIAVAAADLIPMPDALGFNEAAILPVTYGTTLYALQDRAYLKPGETLAILGASGGVGQAAIEIGKLIGARVIACSAADKLDFCRAMGADETVDYDGEDVKLRLKALTGGRGVDVVFDAVGDKYSEPALRACAWRGRFLTIGFAAGAIPRIPLNLLLLKNCDIRGVFWGESLVHEPDTHGRNMRQLMDWVIAGRLKPHIHAVVPLADTVAALEDLAARRVRGKLVVAP